MTESEYVTARKAVNENHAATMAWLRAHKTNAIPAKIAATMPHAAIVNNNLRGAVELYEFVNDPPDQYFLYVSEDRKEAMTWNGEKLGKVFFGQEWRDNFGGIRVPIDVYAVNGRRYHGTYFKSGGDYARIKQYKTKALEAAV